MQNSPTSEILKMRRAAPACLLLLLIVGCGVTPDRSGPEAAAAGPASVPVELPTVAGNGGFDGAAVDRDTSNTQDSATVPDAPGTPPQIIEDNAPVPTDIEPGNPNVVSEAPTGDAASEPAGSGEPASDTSREATVNPEPQPGADDRSDEAPASEHAAPSAAPSPVPEQAATQTRQPAPKVAPKANQAKTEAVSQTSQPEPKAEVMDLDGLEARLRKTKAIGLFTKLELKSQVQDLLEDVEDYHQSRNSLNLSQLEEHFNLLVMKLLVLLEGEDPQLHQDIARARPALWTTLADPAQFSSLKGP